MLYPAELHPRASLAYCNRPVFIKPYPTLSSEGLSGISWE
jgi:hypothetical protein